MMVNLGTAAVATAVTSLAPWRAMPSFSYLRPTMKPVMFCRNTRGTLRWQHSSMKCAPLTADSLNRMPLLAMMPTCMPSMRAKPQTRVLPKRALNSSNTLPSTMRAMISRTSNGLRVSVGITPYSSCASKSGAAGTASVGAAGLFLFKFFTAVRARARACRSLSARWSATPDRRVCTSPPPRSSALTTSPVAAFTSGGPPRKMVPWFLTMMDSSLMAGT